MVDRNQHFQQRGFQLIGRINMYGTVLLNCRWFKSGCVFMFCIFLLWLGLHMTNSWLGLENIMVLYKIAGNENISSHPQNCPAVWLQLQPAVRQPYCPLPSFLPRQEAKKRLTVNMRSHVWYPCQPRTLLWFVVYLRTLFPGDWTETCSEDQEAFENLRTGTWILTEAATDWIKFLLDVSGG